MGKLIALMLAAIGCGPTWHEARSPDISPPVASMCVWLPAATRPAAISAVQMWARVILPDLRLVVSSGLDCDYIITEVASTPDADTATLAYTSDVGGHSVRLVTGRYEPDTLGIVLHELGHVFGAQHVAGTLMAPDWGRGMVCPDAATVVQVAAWNHWKLSDLGYCYL